MSRTGGSTMTRAQARRVAIHAQGLARTGRQRRPETVTMAHLQRVIDRVGLFQIDSVNVLARAHLLPAFSRLGAYDTALLTRASRGTPARPRRLMEYWAHVAAYIPPETFVLMRHRMRRYARSRHVTEVRAAHPQLVDEVLSIVAERGPVSAAQVHELLGHERGPKVHWGWNWTTAKRVLEAAFLTGDVAVAHRTPQFERAYDLPDRVLPAGLHAAPELDESDAVLRLTEIAARAYGISTVRCLADYFRMGTAQTADAVRRLVADGTLEPVRVAGWDRTTYLHAEAARPRRTEARALLAPFDPMVFERRRLEELFGMRYRIGIYTPAVDRVDGYYVLPFLLGDEIAGKVDLKADRAAGTLIVRTAFVQEGTRSPSEVAVELSAELVECAGWLGLGRLDLADDARGDLVGPLRSALQHR